jgi:hypothetical protein
MSDWNSVKKSILAVKTKLPFNGDWLFVSDDPPAKQHNQEAPAVNQLGGIANPEAEKTDIHPENEEIDYCDSRAIRQALYSNELDLIKIIYERAMGHESIISNIASRVYDKAKTLLSTASFASAVLFGVVSFILFGLPRFRGWVIIVEVMLFIILGSHLIRALTIAMSVMTREQLIYTRPSEFLFPTSVGKDKVLDAYKDAIAQIVAYANLTNEKLRERVNKLMTGQHAFRWGLIYFVLLSSFHLVVLTVSPAEQPKDLLSRIVELEEKVLPSMAAKHDELIDTIKQLTTQLSQAHTDNAVLLKQLKDTQDALEKAKGGSSRAKRQ